MKRLIFDIMIDNGDIKFNITGDSYSNGIKDGTPINYEKYYLANKIYVHINIGQSSFNQLIVNYEAILNSFLYFSLRGAVTLSIGSLSFFVSHLALSAYV